MELSGHIRKRTSKKGEVSYQIIIELPNDPITGKRNRKYKTLTDCTKKQAEREMRKIMDELESGKYIEKDDITLAEWMKKWIDLYKKGISPTTQRGYENQIKIYILSQPISKKRIQEITTDDVQSWINTLMDASPTSNNKISAKTIRNVYTNLNAALNKAVSLKKISSNPCAEVTLPKCRKYQGEVYDEEEIAKLLKCCEGKDIELMIKLALTLGLRRGELLALKWSHIDFNKQIVKINENMVYVGKDVAKAGYIIKSPKSESGNREITITEKLTELLQKYYKIFISTGKTDGFVICQPNGEPYTPNALTRKFDRFLKANNLKKIRLHDLRHTNATLMLKHGISAREAQSRLGHADVSVTLGTYSHILSSMEKSTANTIESAVLCLA